MKFPDTYDAVGMEELDVAFLVLFALFDMLLQLPPRVDPLLVDVVGAVLLTDFAEVPPVHPFQVIFIFLRGFENKVLLAVLDLALDLLVLEHDVLCRLVPEINILGLRK